MANTIKIAIDAMGGDHGVSVTVPAALDMLQKYQNLHLILVGQQDLIQEQIDLYKDLEKIDKSRFSIKHASQSVAMDEAPSKALRNKKDSSMRVAVNLVKDGDAQACVSAGNTGALMATARFVLKTVPGIDRPAIISSLPTYNPEKEVRMLDLGANVDSCADHLYQFAIMGSVLAAAVSGIKAPRVGLLNIGEEEIKGNDQVKHTAQLLSECEKINYIGYIEGDDIFRGGVDVVVCDGFVGNVALKAMEGITKMIGYYVKQEFKKNLYTKLTALIGIPILKSFKKKLDPGRHNGASFIGLNGIVVKSHGSANRQDFGTAIREAVLEVDKNVPQLLREQVGALLEDAEIE